MSYLPRTLTCPRCHNQLGLTGHAIYIRHRSKPPHELHICHSCKWIWDEMKASMRAQKEMPNIAILRRSSFSPKQWEEWQR